MTFSYIAILIGTFMASNWYFNSLFRCEINQLWGTEIIELLHFKDYDWTLPMPTFAESLALEDTDVNKE